MHEIMARRISLIFFLFVSNNVLLVLFQFLQWKPPSWIYESEVIMGKSIFSVSETALSKNFLLITGRMILRICSMQLNSFAV